MVIWDKNNNWTFWHYDLAKLEYAEAAAKAAQWPAVIVATDYAISIVLMLEFDHMQTVTPEISIEGFNKLDISLFEGELGEIFIYLITFVFTVDSLRGWWAIRLFDKSDVSES